MIKVKFLKILFFFILFFFHSWNFADEIQNFLISDRQSFKNALDEKIFSVSDWIESLNETEWSLLCLGEKHDILHRDFVKEYIVSGLKIDSLLLEARPLQVEQIIDKMKNSENSVMLLSARIDHVLSQAQVVNPQLKIIGVDQTSEQKTIEFQENRDSGRQHFSRDSFIALNIANLYNPNERLLALYGASHCSYFDINFGFKIPFMRLLENHPISTQSLSVKLFQATKKDKSLLQIYLEDFGYGHEPFVITKTKFIEPFKFNYRLELLSLFQSYDAIIYMPIK